jgi:hypothetical protein
MSDVFGPRGKKPSTGTTPTPAGKSTTQAQSTGSNCHIEYDNETGEMRLTLPTHLAKYKNRLSRDLYEEYFLANPDAGTMGDINAYIDDWLQKHGDDPEFG